MTKDEQRQSEARLSDEQLLARSPDGGGVLGAVAGNVHGGRAPKGTKGGADDQTAADAALGGAPQRGAVSETASLEAGAPGAA